MRLHGVHFPPRSEGRQRRSSSASAAMPGTGSMSPTDLHRLYPEAHVVAFHYRGYRPSTGSPSAKALLADAPLVHDAAVDRVPSRTTVVAAGFSIGSGVAASLRRTAQVDGLILVTPFDSLKAVARRTCFPGFRSACSSSTKWTAADALQGSHVPVAIIAGERDEIIRPAPDRGASQPGAEPGLRPDYRHRRGPQRHLSNGRNLKRRCRKPIAADSCRARNERNCSPLVLSEQIGYEMAFKGGNEPPD